MRIAVSSQNFKTVTGHAGKARRFIVFDASPPCDPAEVDRLDLPKGMAFHDFTGGAHPLDEMDVILSAGAGEGFVRKLAQRGVKVLVTGETDPRLAVLGFLQGSVKAAAPHEHDHGPEHGHRHAHRCCHGHSHSEVHSLCQEPGKGK